MFLNKNHKHRALIGIMLTIPFFMWLMPYGSFDPREMGFWMSIVCALIIEIPLNLLVIKVRGMTRIMTRKTVSILLLVIASIGFTICMMAFGSPGTFNPKEIGFYSAIGGGIIWFGLMYFILRKNFK